MPQMIPAWINARLTPVEKLDVHQRGLKHPAISVFVMSGRQVLLQQRALNKYHSGGKWANTCCTHPHWDEAFEACAHRRLHEEMGISGVELQHADQIEYRADVGGGLTEHEVVEVYIAQVPIDLPLSLNPEEVAAARWVDLDTLSSDVAAHPERYSVWLEIYLRDHSDRIFGTLPPK